MNDLSLTTIIPCKCPFCGKTEWIHVSTKDWEAYTAGALAQDAFPYLSAAERESIISGLCPACQDDVFGEEEDD